ncbi:ADM_HP2_G0007620.mRNA.1.CDS.1 [Saccharomyces cerevisiae]|nr:ADM_HP2_G0007620.mRNA.1.CDS.1 [Saccharomyces cerevisiae]CAI6422242.1 ADM_HP2_G0007620.mRNA.1.CDS.1 [Saccharomyces cerevisiae]
MTTTSTTSVDGRTSSTLKATLSASGPNSNGPTPAVLPQKPKLTGWAQAAAKALPRQQQQQQQARKDDSVAVQPANTKTKTIASPRRPTVPNTCPPNGYPTNKKFQKSESNNLTSREEV